MALIAELEIIRRSFEVGSDELKKERASEGGATWVQTDRMDGAYQSFLPRIGLLSQDEVSKVMKAYLLLQQHDARLYHISVPGCQRPHFVQVSAQHDKLLAKMQAAMLEPIDQAIGALKHAQEHR